MQDKHQDGPFIFPGYSDSSIMRAQRTTEYIPLDPISTNRMNLGHLVALDEHNTLEGALRVITDPAVFTTLLGVSVADINKNPALRKKIRGSRYGEQAP